MVMPGGTKEDEEYISALGRFVFEFMVAENTLFVTLRQLSGLNRNDAAALLSGSKVDANCSLIRRLYEARDTQIPKEIDDALSHLVMLNSLRNNHLHNEVHPNKTVSNEIRALPKRVQTSPTSVKLLIDGNNDLFKIISILVSHFSPETARTQDAFFQNSLRGPWLYTPPQPENNRQKPRAKNAKRKPPPKSSRE